MRRLVQRIERQPPLAVGDRLVRAAGLGQGAHQPVERDLELPAQRRRRRPLPVVEGHAVAQAEARQQVAPVQHHGRGQRANRRRAAARRSDQRSEPADVDRIVLQLEADSSPSGVEPPAAQRRAQRRERPPQRGPPPVRLRVRPQQVDQQVAPVDAPGHGKVCEQRGRLSRVHTQGLAVDRDPRRPQHVDPERHDTSISNRPVTVQLPRGCGTLVTRPGIADAHLASRP